MSGLADLRHQLRNGKKRLSLRTVRLCGKTLLAIRLPVTFGRSDPQGHARCCEHAARKFVMIKVFRVARFAR
jgi:hypothetical protein